MKTLPLALILACACTQPISPPGDDDPPSSGSDDGKADGDTTAPPTGNGRWARVSTSTGTSALIASAVDTDGSTVVVGWFTNAFDFGAGFVGSRGDRDIFVARFDHDGNPVWTRSFGGDGPDAPASVAIAPDHSVFVYGNLVFHPYSDMPSFAGAPLGPTDGTAGSYVAVLVRYGADGEELWGRTIGHDSAAGSMAIDDDMIAIAGYAQEMELGGGTTRFTGGGFLAALDLDGVGRWVRPFYGQTTGHHTIVLDSQQVIVGSTFRYTGLDIGAPAPIVGFGNDTNLLVAYDHSGAYRWHQVLGGPSGASLEGVSRAADGSLWIAGTFQGVAHFGGATLTAQLGEGYAAHFSRTGQPIASVSSGDPLNDRLYATAAMADGGTVVTGSSIGTSSTVRGLVRRLDSLGATVWEQSFELGNGLAIARAPGGDLVVAGNVGHVLNPPNLPAIPFPNGPELFVMRLAP